jgi:hypothetical protein
MFKKQQLDEDIDTAKKKLPRILWAIYHLVTIGYLVLIIGVTMYGINMLLSATPEMIKQSELAGQHGQLHNIEVNIALGVITIIGIMLMRLIIHTIRKRYFG